MPISARSASSDLEACTLATANFARVLMRSLADLRYCGSWSSFDGGSHLCQSSWAVASKDRDGGTSWAREAAWRSFY